MLPDSTWRDELVKALPANSTCFLSLLIFVFILFTLYNNRSVICESLASGGLEKEWLEPFTKIIIKSEIGGPGKTERV